MTAFTEAWGCGNGPAKRAAPSARLSCGILVFASCSVVPLRSPWGVALFAGVLIGWTAWCGLPRRRLFSALRLAACLFLPLFLFAPFIRAQAETGSWPAALRVPLTIGLRGTACIAVCAAAMAALDLAEFGQGLSGLPLPRALVALVVQIAHQAALLTDESRRTVTALRLRGVPSAGAGMRLRGLFSLPVIWLLRLVARAERVSAAMEVRGFSGLPPTRQKIGMSASDRCAAVLTALVFGAVLYLRWRGA